MSETDKHPHTNGSLAQRLRALPREKTPQRDLWPRIAAWLRATERGRKSRWRRQDLIAMAATLLLAVLIIRPWQTDEVMPPPQPANTAGEEVSAQATGAADLQIRALEAATQPLSGDLEWPDTGAARELQAGLDEYRLAEQQLREALRRYPYDLGLWMQLAANQLAQSRFIRRACDLLGGCSHQA